MTPHHLLKRVTCAAVLCGALLPAPALLWAQAPPQPPRLGGPLIDGSVVRTHGCGAYFFIADRDVFALAQWLSGEPVREGDVLQTSQSQSGFQREGRMTVTNLATGRMLDLVIEKALMNRADFTRTAGQFCK
jgi:hypothetical protein